MTGSFSQYRYNDTLPRREKGLRLVWEIAWLLFFRPTPRWCLHGWRRAILRVFGAKIGAGCRIDPSSFIWAPWNLQLGDYVAFGAQVDCYSMNKIMIGSKTTVSQRAFLCCGSHDVSDLRRPLITAPITIGEHCWIAAEAMVMPGAVIGDGAIIGARSLVSGTLPSWMICFGQPCKPQRARRLNEDLGSAENEAGVSRP